MADNTKERFFKLTFIFCLVFTILACFTAYYTPSTGYELSIYTSTPVFTWCFLLLSTLGSLYIVISDACASESERSNLWSIGLFILFLNRLLLLYIPFIRGYYTWNGDNISHIGYIKDIILTGFISPDNPYPITHILLTEILSLSGMEISFTINHSTALLSGFYVIVIYLLSRVVFPGENRLHLFSIVSTLVVLFDGYHIYLMPNGWSIFYLPLFFFLYFKSIGNKLSFQYHFLFAIMLILYPFFHPLTSVIIIVMLVIDGVTRYFVYHPLNKKTSSGIITKFIPLNSILVLSVTFIPWVLSFQIFHPNLKKFYLAVTTGKSLDVIADMSNTLDKINVHGYELLLFIFKVMGDQVIFIVLSILSSFIFFTKYHFKQNGNFISLISITFFIGFLYLSYLLNLIPGLGNIGSERLVSYLVIFTPIMVGFIFYYLTNVTYISRTNLKVLIILFLIITPSVISLFSLYPSPYIIRPNPQITQMDIHSARWLFVDSNNSEVETTDILGTTPRLADGVLGVSERHNRSISRNFIPEHFNYSQHLYLGDSYASDKFSIISKLDQVIYINIWSSVGRFNEQDFKKFETDCTVNKVYNNGESYVCYIHGIQK